MKTVNILKGLMILVSFFFINVTISANSKANDLVYNLEKENGVVVSETVYNKVDNLLYNYLKHNYKYNDQNQKIEDEVLRWDENSKKWKNDICITFTYLGNECTIQYYKWNDNKAEYVLVPKMTVTIEQQEEIQ